MLSAVMNAAGKSPGGFTINSTLPYSAVKVNDINKQAYLYTLPAGTFNAQYEYDAVLNQPGSHIRFAGVGSKFELEPNSTFRVSDGAQMTFENGGELILQPPTGNQFTKYVVDAGGNLTLQNSASTLQTVTIPSGTVLLVNSTGSLTLNNVRLVLEAGASLALRGGANLSVTGVNGAIIVNNGANFCVEPGAYLSLAQNVNTIQLAGGAINGINTGITGTNTNCQPFCAITYSGNGSIQTSSGCFFFSAGSVINNIACIGTSGSVNVALSGLDPAFPVTYSWSPNPAAGQGTPVISVTTAGNYTVTVTHQNIAKSHVFTVANEPGFSLNAFHFNSSGVSNGAVQIVGGPANAVYSYSWNTNPVQTTAMAQLTPGSHQVTVTNSSGCSATASIVIPAALPFGVGITYNSDPCSIPGPTQATATPLLGQPPYAYSWSPAPAMGQGTENVTFSSSGNYTVTVTDNNSATASATIMVTLPVITAPSSVISTNTTWTGPILIEGEIRINPGVVLTLDNAQVQVRYAQLQDPNLGNTIYERAGIVVAAGSSPKPGGQLIITNNSTVQGCANNWWDGIDVLGNPDAAQSEIFQGLVVISGNSTIKNAWCGIKALVTPRPFVRYYKGLSGGIIKATNANFENNARGVFLGHYIQQSASFFSGCAFTRDVLCPFNNIVYGSQPFKWTGAHLIEIDGVRFAGNTFQNYFVVDGIFSVPQSWGTGILSQGAGYKLQGLSGTGNGNNHFINLTYGIDAGLYSGVARKVIAEGNNFTQTLNGIYIQGGLLDQLLRNEFVLPTVMNAAYPGKGITMVNSSGFLIEGNTVGVTEMNHTYGILFESSGTTGGTVFNNTITGALIGIQVQKNNPNLKLRCNTLDNIDVSGHGLAVVNNPAGTTSTLKQQGSDCNTTGGNINQAGNEWLNVSCSSSSPDNRQIFVDNNVTFDYWAHELNQQGQPTTVPLCSSPTWKASYMYKCDFVNKTANSCASYIPGIITPNPLTDPQAYLTDIAEVKNEYATYLAEAELAIAELKGDLDGGDTQGLLEFLQEGGHTAENVRDHLIDALPLSDTVLLMVINLPARLPDSYLDKVVAPNAPFSYRVLDALYELTPIIAPNIMAGIEHAHQNIRQYPQLAELLKAYNWWHGEMRLLDNERHRVLQQQGDLQASMALLHTSDELEELRALAETYLAKNQTDSVKAILGRIAQDTVASRIDENVQYMLFMQVMVDLVDSARFIGDMDSLQLAVMQQIASSGYEISDKAEVVLRVALQQNTHHQPYLIPEQQPARTKESARDRYWKQAEALQVKQNHLELYPNPASGQVRARYQLSEGAGIIVMQSLLGQEVARIVIGSQSTETLIETHGLAAGVYLIRLETAGRVQQVQKLVVVKE